MRIAVLLPLALAATLAAPALEACVQPGCWTTGVYQYDGAGNVRAMGADRFTYDRVGRLATASIARDEVGLTSSYGYDPYGNLVSWSRNAGSGSTSSTFGVDSATNRLTSPATYDAAGNLTRHPEDGETYRWDADTPRLLIVMHELFGHGVNRLPDDWLTTNRPKGQVVDYMNRIRQELGITSSRVIVPRPPR